MTVDELTSEEDRLLAEVAKVTGLMEEKTTQLRQRGVFSAYARVHAAYADLADRGDGEALRRALFLQWYEDSEPACFSGLWGLSPDAERAVLELLDGMAATDAFDPELRWMLPWYDFITDFHFGARDGLSSLKRWLREHATAEFPDALTRDVALSGRGQMSRYWYRPDEAASR